MSLGGGRQAGLSAVGRLRSGVTDNHAQYFPALFTADKLAMNRINCGFSRWATASWKSMLSSPARSAAWRGLRGKAPCRKLLALSQRSAVITCREKSRPTREWK